MPAAEITAMKVVSLRITRPDSFSRPARTGQKILFAEQYPDDFKALSKKLADSYDKKEKKLKERLKELNNDNTEEA